MKITYPFIIYTDKHFEIILHLIKELFKAQDADACSRAFNFPVNLHFVKYTEIEIAEQYVDPQTDRVVVINLLNDAIVPLLHPDNEGHREGVGKFNTLSLP